MAMRRRQLRLRKLSTSMLKVTKFRWLNVGGYVSLPESRPSLLTNCWRATKSPLTHQLQMIGGEPSMLTVCTEWDRNSNRTKTTNYEKT